MLVIGYSMFVQSENTDNATRVTVIATSQSGYYGFAQSPKNGFTSVIEYLSFPTRQTEYFASAND
jgi:hypothetical protein